MAATFVVVEGGRSQGHYRIAHPTPCREDLPLTQGSAMPATDIAILDGGCFWCLEAVFDGLAGVKSVESGFAGGSTPAEAVEAELGAGSGAIRS